MKKFFFIIPEFPETVTGGTLYDLTLLGELRNKYFPIKKISVNFTPNRSNLRILSRIFNLPKNSTLCIDGLLAPYLKNSIKNLCEKFNIILLIHHPVTQENNIQPLLNLKDYFVERSIFNKKLKIITVSKFIKKQLYKYTNNFKIIHVAEPGIEEVFFEDYEYKNTRNIIAIGNIIPRKGYHLLLEALSDVSEDWFLTIVGNYDINKTYFQSLNSKIKKYKMHNKIKFTGVKPREEMIERMRNSKLFVLPTLFEGYGMSILEAAIMGLHVITSDLPVLRESLKGKNVQFINCLQQSALSSAIQDSLKNDYPYKSTADKYMHSWSNTRKKFLEAVNGKK